MRRKGFTLIEVLVVVAIIALLIAILMPSLRGAQAVARAVVCRHNQHQVHLAIEAYAFDAKGWYPLAEEEINPHTIADPNEEPDDPPDDTEPKKTLVDLLRAKKDGILDAMYCPQAPMMEEVAQATDYPPKNKTDSVIDTPENRKKGNISLLYWSMKDRSDWRSTNIDKYDASMDAFRPRWLRNSGQPIPFAPSQDKSPCNDEDPPCGLQDYRPGGDGGYWVLSDFFRKGAPFPHTRQHKSGLNVLYLDGHAALMFGQPRAHFK